MAGHNLAQTISMPALGRHFELGMLYDCCSEQVIQGPTLWDESIMKANMEIHENFDAFLKIITPDTNDFKAYALEVTDSLKISLMGGLVQVGGSGKYLEDQISMSNQDRITLQHKCITTKSTLNVMQLGKENVQNPEIFKTSSATHVVTGICYGIQSFFVFDKKQTQQTTALAPGSWHYLVNLIPRIEINQDGSLRLNEEDKRNADSLQVTFYGDITPARQPSSFAEAVLLYTSLARNDGQRACPITVTLFPLTSLESQACFMVREISGNQAHSIERVFEDFHKIDMMCADALQTQACHSMVGMQNEIVTFRQMTSRYIIAFQKQLSIVFPSIRRGKGGENDLDTLLDCKEKSPFAYGIISAWVDEKHTEARIIQSCIENIDSLMFASRPGALESARMDHTCSNIVCLVFRRPRCDPLLQAMDVYLRNGISNVRSVLPPNIVKTANTVRTIARSFIGMFLGIKQTNPQENCKFLIAEELVETVDYKAFVCHFKDGELVDQNSASVWGSKVPNPQPIPLARPPQNPAQQGRTFYQTLEHKAATNRGYEPGMLPTIPKQRSQPTDNQTESNVNPLLDRFSPSNIHVSDSMVATGFAEKDSEASLLSSRQSYPLPTNTGQPSERQYLSSPQISSPDHSTLYNAGVAFSTEQLLTNKSTTGFDQSYQAGIPLKTKEHSPNINFLGKSHESSLWHDYSGVQQQGIGRKGNDPAPRGYGQSSQINFVSAGRDDEQVMEQSYFRSDPLQQHVHLSRPSATIHEDSHNRRPDLCVNTNLYNRGIEPGMQADMQTVQTSIQDMNIGNMAYRGVQSDAYRYQQKNVQAAPYGTQAGFQNMPKTQFPHHVNVSTNSNEMRPQATASQFDPAFQGSVLQHGAKQWSHTNRSVGHQEQMQKGYMQEMNRQDMRPQRVPNIEYQQAARDASYQEMQETQSTSVNKTSEPCVQRSEHELKGTELRSSKLTGGQDMKTTSRSEQEFVNVNQDQMKEATEPNQMPEAKPPPPPGIPECSNIEHDSVTLSWEKPDNLPKDISEYEISCKEIDGYQQLFRTKGDNQEFRVQDLRPGTYYEFKVRACSKAGLGEFSGQSKATLTLPTSPPGKPRAKKCSVSSAALEWEKPTVVGKSKIKSYIVLVFNSEEEKWNEVPVPVNVTSTEIEIKENITYKFKIVAVCGKNSKSKESPESEELRVVQELRDRLKDCAKIISQSQPQVYQLNLEEIFKNKDDNIRKVDLKVPSKKPHVTEKVIMVVGATGSGKTTLINGMVNYILGVEWNDDFRFKLIVENEGQTANQAKSQTSWITSYTIHHQKGSKVSYTLTIIDTPGFGDTAGIIRDKQITEQIRKFFSRGGDEGVDHLDAVGFVAQSSLPRLTPTQRYIFDSILALFGKDIEGNIFMLLTFADAQKPPVLDGLQEAKLPYQKYFKFNNSALFAENNGPSNGNIDDEADTDAEGSYFDEMFWKMGAKSFKLFLDNLNKVSSKTLILTKDVLNERNQLECSVQGIQTDIQIGLNKLEQLNREMEVLQAHQSDIERNKNFEYTVVEETAELIPITSGDYTTNCLTCKRTCHYPCGIQDNGAKDRCWAMKDGKCKICPGNCSWDMHKNLPHKYEIKRVETRKTAADLKARYEEAQGKKLSHEQLIHNIHDEFQAIQIKVICLTETVRMSIKRLKEIALKPSPLSTTEYVDLLIQSEKDEARPGWMERVAQLKEVRKTAEHMKNMADKGYDPFAQYQEKIAQAQKTKKGSIWSSVGNAIKNFKLSNPFKGFFK